MPRYDFQCTSCHHVWEASKPVQVPPLPCPVCRSPSKVLPPLINTTGVKKGRALDRAKKLGFRVLKRKSKGVYREE
jgi:putative FmdB family regulatory protein